MDKSQKVGGHTPGPGQVEWSVICTQEQALVHRYGPELLEACKRAVAYAQDFKRLPPVVIRKLEQTISKAEGRA